MPALVRALNNVDLPTFGMPTIPHLRLMTLPSRDFHPIDATRSGVSPRRRTAGMQFQHRALHLAPRQVRPCVEAASDCGVDRLALLQSRRLEHEVDDFLLTEFR